MDNHPLGWPPLYETPLGMFCLFGKVMMDGYIGIGFIQSIKLCSKVAAGGMSRSNPVVDRGTFLAVAKSFFFDKESFFRLHMSSTLTDPHFLRWLLGLAFNTLFDFSSREKESDYPIQKRRNNSNCLNFGRLGFDSVTV